MQLNMSYSRRHAGQRPDDWARLMIEAWIPAAWRWIAPRVLLLAMIFVFVRLAVRAI